MRSLFAATSAGTPKHADLCVWDTLCVSSRGGGTGPATYSSTDRQTDRQRDDALVN